MHCEDESGKLTRSEVAANGMGDGLQLTVIGVTSGWPCSRLAVKRRTRWSCGSAALQGVDRVSTLVCRPRPCSENVGLQPPPPDRWQKAFTLIRGCAGAPAAARGIACARPSSAAATIAAPIAVPWGPPACARYPPPHRSIARDRPGICLLLLTQEIAENLKFSVKPVKWWVP